MRSSDGRSTPWTRRGLLAAAAALASCVVSPQPSPPMDEPDLFGGEISIVDTGAEDLFDHLSFEAGAGAVDPPRGVVVVTNLDTDDPPSIAVVRDDGSFSIALPGVPGHAVRFQVKQDEGRSQPVDIAVDATGQVANLVEDAPACLEIDPARYVALDGDGDARSVVVKNACPDTVRIAPPRMRRGRGPFAFSPTAAIEIAPGSIAFVTVRAAGDALETEDVLFLDVLEPLAARRAITLAVPE